jgi:hypothetical protein
MGLTGPSREIKVEPLREQPSQPEPAREKPAPVEPAKREKAPA